MDEWSAMSTAPVCTVILAADDAGLVATVILFPLQEKLSIRRNWLFRKTVRVVREAGVYLYNAIPLNGGYVRVSMPSDGWTPTRWRHLPPVPAPPRGKNEP